MRILMIFLFFVNYIFAYSPQKEARDLGLTLHDYNFLMGLTGFSIGFSILFLLILFLKD